MASESRRRFQRSATRARRIRSHSRWLRSNYDVNQCDVDTKKVPYLNDLGHAVRELARGQRLEESSINEDVLWLPEGTDEVLAVWGVDRRLSTDGRVDHGEECGRNLAESHATHASRGQYTAKAAYTETHKVAATKPIRSPMTPPPTARTTVSRVHAFRRRKSSSSALHSRLLLVSPGGRT